LLKYKYMINKIIKGLRIQKNISQEQMANNLSLPRYTIANWEQGRTEPNIEQIKLICIYFNISADELLEIDTPREREKVQINNSFNNSNNIKVKIK